MAEDEYEGELIERKSDLFQVNDTTTTNNNKRTLFEPLPRVPSRSVKPERDFGSVRQVLDETDWAEKVHYSTRKHWTTYFFDEESALSWILLVGSHDYSGVCDRGTRNLSSLRRSLEGT